MASLAKVIKAEASVVFNGVNDGTEWHFHIRALTGGWSKTLADPYGAVCTYVQERINEAFYGSKYVHVGPEQCHYKFDHDPVRVTAEYWNELSILRRKVMTEDELAAITPEILTTKEFPRDSNWASKQASFYWRVQDFVADILSELEDRRGQSQDCVEGEDQPGETEGDGEHMESASGSELSASVVDWAAEGALCEESIPPSEGRPEKKEQQKLPAKAPARKHQGRRDPSVFAPKRAEGRTFPKQSGYGSKRTSFKPVPDRKSRPVPQAKPSSDFEYQLKYREDGPKPPEASAPPIKKTPKGPDVGPAAPEAKEVKSTTLAGAEILLTRTSNGLYTF